MAVTTGAVAGRKGSDVGQDKHYTTEAELRDHLAAVAREHGWRVSTEWRMTPCEQSWGIADLEMTKAGQQPIIVECKQRIRTMSGLRMAAGQAHAYRTTADVYFGEPCAAYVVAERIGASREAQHVALGYLDVHCRTAAEMVALLDRDAREPGYAQFDRDLNTHLYGATARGEDIDEGAALMRRLKLTPEKLEDMRELRRPAGSLAPSSSVYHRSPYH